MTPTEEKRNDEFADMFELAPVSLWLEDYSAVQRLFEDWRREGVRDLRSFLRQDPERVATCSRNIRVIKVNQRTLELFGANSQEQLVDKLPQVFRDDMFEQHLEELVALWEGKARFSTAASQR